jgi:hypothetical protein
VARWRIRAVTSTSTQVKAKRRKNRRKALQRQTTAHRQIQEVEMEMLDKKSLINVSMTFTQNYKFGFSVQLKFGQSKSTTFPDL